MEKKKEQAKKRSVITEEEITNLMKELGLGPKSRLKIFKNPPVNPCTCAPCLYEESKKRLA